MDDKVKSETLTTLRSIRDAANEAQSLFSDLRNFFRGAGLRPANVLTVADVIATGIERGLRAAAENRK